MHEMLAREFDSSSVALKLEGKEEHGANSLCTVVLENTGEELHVQAQNASFASETETLMLVSKIGSYVVKQRLK